MPHLPHSIELHDSELASIDTDGVSATILLAPAYVHRDGKGWLQDAEIVLGQATWSPIDLKLPISIADGVMETRAGPYHNLLMLPLKWDGPVSLDLELTSGIVLRAAGTSVEVRLLGDPKYVEEFA